MSPYRCVTATRAMSGITRRIDGARARRDSWVLVASGLDPCGAAGLLLDTAVARLIGAGAAGVATCLTVQGPSGVRAVRSIDASIIEDQIGVLLRELPIRAVKVGLF